MPLYEFQCAECQDHFEELVRSAVAVHEVKCPQCGSAQVRRKISVFASKSSGGAGFAPTAAAASCSTGGT